MVPKSWLTEIIAQEQLLVRNWYVKTPDLKKHTKDFFF